jgi:hypothetical protein
VLDGKYGWFETGIIEVETAGRPVELRSSAAGS